MAIDFNTAGPQREIEVIPARTIAVVQIAVRPGGGSYGGWLRPSNKKDPITGQSTSQGLDLEFTVVEGPYNKRKFWQLLTLEESNGNTQAHDISMETLRAIIESARGVLPNDESEDAKAKRSITGWGDLHGLRFVAQIGVRPPEGNYPAKNTLAGVITPDRKSFGSRLLRSRFSRSNPRPTAPATAPHQQQVQRHRRRAHRRQPLSRGQAGLSDHGRNHQA